MDMKKYDIYSKLAKNFTLIEFLKSDTAKVHGIDLILSLNDEIYENLKKVANVLQFVRDYVGFPIYISSGFRNFELNQLVGGVANSKHLRGLASDICVSNITQLRTIYNILSKCKEVEYLYLKRTRKGAYIHFQLY